MIKLFGYYSTTVTTVEKMDFALKNGFEQEQNGIVLLCNEMFRYLIKMSDGYAEHTGGVCYTLCFD